MDAGYYLDLLLWYCASTSSHAFLDVFGEKIVVWEKCLLVDRMESMKELWSIRFKFPFPYGTRLATVERYPSSSYLVCVF